MKHPNAVFFFGDVDYTALELCEAEWVCKYHNNDGMLVVDTTDHIVCEYSTDDFMYVQYSATMENGYNIDILISELNGVEVFLNDSAVVDAIKCVDGDKECENPIKMLCDVLSIKEDEYADIGVDYKGATKDWLEQQTDLRFFLLRSKYLNQWELFVVEKDAVHSDDNGEKFIEAYDDKFKLCDMVELDIETAKRYFYDALMPLEEYADIYDDVRYACLTYVS